MSSVNKPVRVQAGRAQAGSSVTAGSCWCSPASEAPGRRAGSPGPGWLGWHSCGLHAARGLLLHSLRCGFPCCHGFFDGHLESHRLLHCLLCLSYLHHVLEEKYVPYHSSDNSSFTWTTCRAFKNSTLSMTLQFYVVLTRCRSIDLSHVTRWRYRGHHEIEGDGEVHGRHGTVACANHTNLVMGLEIHIGCTSCCGKKYRFILLPFKLYGGVQSYFFPHTTVHMALVFVF